MPDLNPSIGALRWLVQLACRTQSAPAGQTGILESYTILLSTHADIQPIHPMTFWASMQTDTPVTHLVRLRWLDALDNTQAIIRTTQLRDRSDRVEVFRVRRMKELAGRKRFIELECELEDLR